MPASETSLDVQTLFSDHHGWLMGWLRRKLGNAFDAADLAHDTFVRVLGKGNDQVVHESRAYVTTIAGGLVASHWRRHALEQAWLKVLAARPELLAPSPEERHLILETLEEIARLLHCPPAQVREAFLLSQLDGLTYPQIAEQLGVSVNVVQKAMTRAVAHCYKALYSARSESGVPVDFPRNPDPHQHLGASQLGRHTGGAGAKLIRHWVVTS